MADLEDMLAAPTEASLDDVLLRCAAVRLQCCADEDAGSAMCSQSSRAPCDSPVGGALGAAGRSVAITSATGAVKAKHVVAGILELVRDIPGSEAWVFDGMSKHSAAGSLPVVYELSFIR